MPPEGPELEAQREVRKNADNEWSNAVSIITGNTPIDPINVDLFTKAEEGGAVTKCAEEDMLKSTCLGLESEYKASYWLTIFEIIM